MGSIIIKKIKDKCCICWMENTSGPSIQCGHPICYSCYTVISSDIITNRCPLCRRDLPTKQQSLSKFNIKKIAPFLSILFGLYFKLEFNHLIQCTFAFCPPKTPWLDNFFTLILWPMLFYCLILATYISIILTYHYVKMCLQYWEVGKFLFPLTSSYLIAYLYLIAFGQNNMFQIRKIGFGFSLEAKID